jgi:hypothetical protein
VGHFLGWGYCTHHKMGSRIAQGHVSVNSKLPVTQSQSTESAQKVASPSAVTNEQLLTLASNKYADGNLPLGDNKYVTDAPKKGIFTYVTQMLIHLEVEPKLMARGYMTKLGISKKKYQLQAKSFGKVPNFQTQFLARKEL